MKKRPADSMPLEPRTEKMRQLTRDHDPEAARAILELFGQIDWDETYDHKAARGRR